MPHLATWVCAITTGKLSDYLINNGKLKIITQRRLFSTIGNIDTVYYVLVKHPEIPIVIIMCFDCITI